ncbi:uncharacterized protein TM35_000072310 [Trypanosoma theileri]|uniref:Ubiquitin-like domain-containing protein n=1 Tax=Trypanosoma theileri TaxID=67003 RepID=A0A1X0P1K0_9TRYP|nr:uncharacterized protein TM35_000072310 [Trypanosoma theileri]ORC90807.1 hypothetical protein TM35_000072310 [Trypanosoma theileri]
MSSLAQPHYVRLKRYNLTIFLHCDVNHDTVQAIKERYEKLTGRIFYNVRLYLGRQNLEDFSTLYNCGIESEGAELIVVHSKGPKNDGTGEYYWEEIEEAMKPPPAPPKEERNLTQSGGDTGASSREGGEQTEDNSGPVLVSRSEGGRGLHFVEPEVEAVDS